MKSIRKEFEVATVPREVGDGIAVSPTGWTFGGSMVEHFESHIRSSVPLYDVGHDLICEVSDFFVQEESVCYELGTSVGTLLRKLAQRHSAKPRVRWVGIDTVPEMVEKARSLPSPANVSFVLDDINTTPLEASDLIVCYYVVQFVPPHRRQQLIDRIYESLRWGGAFICFEKVRACDARFQDYMTQVYHEWKMHQGYSAAEIMNKASSLKSKLEPFSTQGNIDLFRRAGFVDIMTIQKWVSFEGFLCVK
ncbi:MAG: methyltransferase domain-containing protein [Bdellovibrionales bacterium]|nr:methyltransferase domain-containing protein [Bdellovibrionales bacterium]